MFYSKISKLFFVSGTNKICKFGYLQRRELSFLLEWFINVFNWVDRERLKLVGPDCTCAEWLLRNGASVRFKGHTGLLSDYNTLIKMEETEAPRLKIEEVYARDASLNNKGLHHFKDCNYVKKITFIFCVRVSDVKNLHYVADSLEYLELTSCFNIDDKGLMEIQNFRNLKTLILYDLVSVKKKEECEAALKKALPNCNIDFQEKRKVH